MKKSLPKSVKIGAYTVLVVYERNLMTDDCNCGNFSCREMMIRIDPDLSEEFQWGVFYHEIVEAFKHIYSIESLEKDHHAIELLGEALHQVLRDNGSEVLPA